MFCCVWKFWACFRVIFHPDKGVRNRAFSAVTEKAMPNIPGHLVHDRALPATVKNWKYKETTREKLLLVFIFWISIALPLNCWSSSYLEVGSSIILQIVRLVFFFLLVFDYDFFDSWVYVSCDYDELIWYLGFCDLNWLIDCWSMWRRFLIGLHDFRLSGRPLLDCVCDVLDWEINMLRDCDPIWVKLYRKWVV